MVTDFLLQWFDGILNGVIDLMPTDSLPAQLSLGWITDMNYFLPVSEMFGLFVIFFALGGPFVGSSLLIWWVVGVLRGGATKA